jgi:hypothetical protein
MQHRYREFFPGHQVTIDKYHSGNKKAARLRCCLFLNVQLHTYNFASATLTGWRGNDLPH